MKPHRLTLAATYLDDYADMLRSSYHVGDGRWPGEDGEIARQEHDELRELAEELRDAAGRPDPLGEALNSGNGTYKP